MPILKKIFSVLFNKYLLTTIAFIVWMVFFDSNNLITRNKLQATLDSLNQVKQYYLQEISQDSAMYQGLLRDSNQLERFAREKYLMKRDHEDLFLVVDTTEDPHQE
jgi:tRNA G18 (ribose-2'-O)-methylase SpoU